MPSHVLRIPRSDEEGSFVLARATPSGQASKPLDLRLVATEGESPYSVSLRHERIDKSRYQSAPCSPDEWESILKFLLLGQGWVDNIDATATVKDESDVTITIRKRVQNITQRLGTISLAYDEAEGIELFDWCGDAADSHAQAQQALEEATAKQSTLQAAVDDLKAQLDDFLAAKDADETVMLEKFCTLLNEKKVKIRVQQKMLASAAQDKSRVDEIAEIKEEEEEEEEPPLPTTRGGKTTKASSSSTTKQKAASTKRGAKRSAAAAAVSGSDNDSDNDEFEQTATRSTRNKGKGKGKASAQDSDDLEDLDESTDSGDAATESDDDGGAEPMDEDDDNNDAEPAKTIAAPVPEEGPPPRRVLPFGKARSAAESASSSSAPAPAVPAPAAIKPSSVPADDNDTDSDDEL